MTDEPQDHGWRAHLDLAQAASRCAARRKRDGKPCCQPAMPNGRLLLVSLDEGVIPLLVGETGCLISDMEEFFPM